MVQQLGFSTSCSRAAQRSAGSAGIFSSTVRVCSQTSFLWWGLFCIKPTIGSSSGSTTPMTSTYSRSTGAAAGPHSSLSSSAFTRSGERFFSRGAFPRRAAAVPGSISNPRTAANRSPRKMRRPSSAKRQSGSPTARMSRFFRSACPPKGSMTSPVLAFKAMAPMVKSRRARSSSSPTPKVTASGWRPSV